MNANFLPPDDTLTFIFGTLVLKIISKSKPIIIITYPLYKLYYQTRITASLCYMAASVECQGLRFDITAVPIPSGSLGEPTLTVVRPIIEFSKREAMNGSGKSEAS